MRRYGLEQFGRFRNALLVLYATQKVNQTHFEKIVFVGAARRVPHFKAKVDEIGQIDGERLAKILEHIEIIKS